MKIPAAPGTFPGQGRWWVVLFPRGTPMVWGPFARPALARAAQRALEADWPVYDQLVAD